MTFIHFLKSLIDEKSIKGSSFYVLSAQSIFLGTLFIADLYFARILTKDDFGTWKQFLIIVQFLLPLLFVGIPEGFRYYSALERKRWYIHFFNILIFAILFTVILCIMMFAGFFDFIIVLFRNTFLKPIAFLIPFIFFFMGLASLQRYLYILLNKTRKILIGNIVFSIIFLTGIFLIKFYRNYSLIFLIGLIFLLASTGRFIYLILGLKLKNTLKEYKLSYLSYIRKYIIYGFPLFLATISGVVAKYTDQIIVSNLAGVENFAVYSVGAIEIPVITMIAGAVSQTIYPRLVEYVSSGEMERAKKLWYQATIKVSKITYPIIIFMIVFSKEIISFFYTEKYLGAVPVFIVYLLFLFIRNNTYGAILLASGNTTTYFAGQFVMTILNIPLSIALFQKFGIIGPAIATVALVYLMHMYYLYKEQWHVQIILQFIRDCYTTIVLSVIVSLVLKMILTKL